MLSVTDFDPKGTISEVRVHAGLYLDILDADRSPNAVRVHAGTTQVDFEVDPRPPPADFPPGDHLITMVKEMVILYKKEFQKMKKSRISHWSESDENAIDCEIACDCVKRANVVLHEGPCKEIFRQKAHSYPQADICSAPHSDHDDTHALVACGAPRPTALRGNKVYF